MVMSPYWQAGVLSAALFTALNRAARAHYADNSQLFYQDGDQPSRIADLLAIKAQPEIDLAALTPVQEQAIAAQVAHKALLFSLLADEDSRALLTALAAFSVLGHQRVRLPYYGPDNIARRKALHRASQRDQEADPGLVAAIQAKWRTDLFSLFDLRAVGRNLRLYTIGEEVYRCCEKPSYHCPTPGGVIKPRPGDVVLDCGAAFGDVSLQFAEAVGEDGHFVCFEPYPLFLRVFQENMAMNPHLTSRIRLIERGVWDVDEATLSFIEGGGGSRIDTSNNATTKIRTTTLDQAVGALGLAKVDFIKMDIEGAELRALKGAEATLRRFRPTLAICLYHNPQDFHEIPAYLDGLGLGYRFHLNHHYVNEWETVLYARVA